MLSYTVVDRLRSAALDAARQRFSRDATARRMRSLLERYGVGF
jgi:hypothetical protein